MSRIRETFASLKRAGRGGFIPFITAGDPDLATTELLLVELAAEQLKYVELRFCRRIVPGIDRVIQIVKQQHQEGP